jgi:hypothetical protein
MTVLDDFISDARTVPLEVAFKCVKGELGRKRLVKGAVEYIGRCPACDGKDRFSINFASQVWFCRQYDGRGGDGLQLIAHKEGLDLKRRAHLLEACAILLDRPVPQEGERETQEERAERKKRIAEQQTESEAKRERQADIGARERQKSIDQGRGIFFRAGDGACSDVEAYLKLRTGVRQIPDPVWENLKFLGQHGYWEGRDERGHMKEIHCGPAMIAPMVDPVGVPGHVTGCHQTWIDLGHAPKFRPDLGADDKGDALPTKKMRGHKKGSVIPVCGDLDCRRWIGAEGIENTVAVAGMEGFRDDTFYFAAGDIGNMCGPADAASGFSHPDLKKQNAKGVWQPVRVAGPVPKPGSAEDCFQLPAHVTELVLLADGDSEFIMTVAAMARAEARLARDGLALGTWWPVEGSDWAGMAAKAAGLGNAA